MAINEEDGAFDGAAGGGGGGGARGGGGGGDDDRTDCGFVLTDKDDLERIEFRLGGIGGGVRDRTDDLLDLIETGEGGRMGTRYSGFGGSGGGGGDFDRVIDSSTVGVGGNEVLGAGNRGGGKSAAVGGASLVVGGKPAAWSSSRRATTGSASSYKARPWWYTEPTSGVSFSDSSRKFSCFGSRYITGNSRSSSLGRSSCGISVPTSDPIGVPSGR